MIKQQILITQRPKKRVGQWTWMFNIPTFMEHYESSDKGNLITLNF